MHRIIEIQSKSGRKEKHKECLHKVSFTPFSTRNDVILPKNPDSRHVSKSGTVNERETSFSEADINYWPHVTCAIVGDSAVNDIDEKRLSMDNRNTKVFYFSRARIREKTYRANHQEKTRAINFTCWNKQPYHQRFLILHVGIKDPTTNNSKKIVDYSLLL